VLLTLSQGDKRFLELRPDYPATVFQYFLFPVQIMSLTREQVPEPEEFF
jgi:hypothetical protein